MTRTTELLQAAAKTLRDGRGLDGHFLEENNVCADELDVFDVLADIIEGVTRLPEKYQLVIRMVGGQDALPPQLGLMTIVNLVKQDLLDEMDTKFSLLNDQKK